MLFGNQYNVEDIMKKIMLTGGHGFLGSHVYSKLKERYDIFVPSHNVFDLRKESDISMAFSDCSTIIGFPDVVIHLAAVAGGIGLNMREPATLFYDNLVMGTLLMNLSHQFGVKKYLSVGTVCAYPKFTQVPFKEEDIWNGYPEETNAPYGLAKKMALVQSQAYRKQYGFNSIYLIPVNLYGPGDNFDPENSHVIPGLIKRFIDAKNQNLDSVTVWGSGKSTREFLYVEDCAEAIVTAMERYDGPEPINIGTGKSITIRGLVFTIADLVGYNGEIIWDSSKPDGQPARMLDISKAKQYFGFEAKTSFVDGLKKTIDWYLTGKGKEKHVN